MELLKYHLPATFLFDFSSSSHFHSWSGVSDQAVVKICNVSAVLGEVRAFGNLHQVCHGAPQDIELKAYSLH